MIRLNDSPKIVASPPGLSVPAESGIPYRNTEQCKVIIGLNGNFLWSLN